MTMTTNDDTKTDELVDDLDTELTTKAEDTDVLELNESVNDDEQMLSTIDNPFNPKTHYEEWQRWDQDNGYYTEEYMARLISMDSDFNADDEFTINMIASRVVADILANDDLEVYYLV